MSLYLPENTMRRHLITLAFLGAAATLWYLGLRDDAALLIAGGILFEIVFWKRLFRRHKTR